MNIHTDVGVLLIRVAHKVNKLGGSYYVKKGLHNKVPIMLLLPIIF
jgi:hypothetical protein